MNKEYMSGRWKWRQAGSETQKLLLPRANVLFNWILPQFKGFYGFEEPGAHFCLGKCASPLKLLSNHCQSVWASELRPWCSHCWVYWILCCRVHCMGELLYVVWAHPEASSESRISPPSPVPFQTWMDLSQSVSGDSLCGDVCAVCSNSVMGWEENSKESTRVKTCVLANSWKVTQFPTQVPIVFPVMSNAHNGPGMAGARPCIDCSVPPTALNGNAGWLPRAASPHFCLVFVSSDLMMLHFVFFQLSYPSSLCRMLCMPDRMMLCYSPLILSVWYLFFSFPCYRLNKPGHSKLKA